MESILDPAAAASIQRQDDASARVPLPHHLGDFTATSRMVVIAALAIIIGAAGAVLAWALLRLIDLFTNLFYYQT